MASTSSIKLRVILFWFVACATITFFCPISRGQQLILIRSGTDGAGNLGACGTSDPLTTVQSGCAPSAQQAFIKSSNVQSPCLCSSNGLIGGGSKPITTACISDSYGTFTTTFVLPSNWTNATLNMALIADDGAQVYLNGSLVATVNLANGVTNLPAITNPSLFQAGTNTLVFYVVNTGNQHYGSPVGRGGPGDCMYVEFSGSVSFLPNSVSIRSGTDGSGNLGACGTSDPLTTVQSSCAPSAQQAFIKSSNTLSPCLCSSNGLIAGGGSKPVTTACISDSYGTFTTTFMLPAINWTNATLNMAVIADDGAQVYLNGSLVATVNLASGVTNLPAITNPSLFQAGTNTLVFYVVNTGNQHYGSPVGRGGAGDCMYVEFSGSVSYFPVPVPVLDIFRAVGLQWVSLTSQSYQVQTSMDMSSWTNFDGVISTPPGTTNTVFDSAEQQQKFYRLLVQ